MTRITIATRKKNPAAASL